jgi:hypothetical protein
MGTSTRPMLLTSPDRANTLVPFAGLGADTGIPGPAVDHDLGYVGQGLHVVEDGGLFPQALVGRKRRTRRGMPRLPSMERIRAVSSPQTKAPAPW